MITHSDDYFTKGCGRCERFETPDCSVHLWSQGLAALRQLCLEAGLTETVKWGHPCYQEGDRNIALLGAHRDSYVLSFCNAALLKDPEQILERAGPNTQTADLVRFKDVTEVQALAPTLKAYLAEAIAYARAGIKPVKTQAEFDLPDELIEALDSDPELAQAFHDLTPGRQRSYAIALGTTQNPATRLARIDKFRPKILRGKGALERE
ncbi:MAG: YdeI/OmpD-associated family protein [Hyphomonadaceae bacterium]